MVNYTVSKVDIGSVIKVWAIYGLIIGVALGIMAMVGLSSVTGNAVTGNSLMALVLSIVAGLVGSIVGGALCALIYNIIARITGGIAVELKQDQLKKIK